MGSFEGIYRKHLGAVFRYAVRCVGRSDIAEEIVSDAFLALYRNLEQIDESQLPGWLLTVVKHRATDYWRRRQVERRHAESQQEESPARSGIVPQISADPAVPVESWLSQCEELRPVHRACLILRYVHGMTRAEIARETGLSETQVKGHLQYALQLLRKELAQTGREP